MSLGLALSLSLGAGNRAPLVNYNFTTGTVPSGVTGTGAANGTAVNVSGLIAAASAPRLDYSLVSVGTLLGLLVEPARTNIVVQADSVTNAAWNVTGVAKSTDGTLDPSGAAFCKATASAGSNKHEMYNAVPYTTTTATNYGVAVYFKPGTQRFAYLNWQGAGGNYCSAVFNCTGTSRLAASETSVGGTSGTIADSYAEYVGNGIYRLVMIGKFTGTSAFFVFGFAGAATGNSFNSTGEITWTAVGTETGYFNLVDAQLGSSMTSHITTTAAALTRTADADSFTIPSGVATLRFTFDDNSTQDVAVSAGSYTIPTNLNRSRIKRIVSI